MADEQQAQIPTIEDIAKLPRWAQVAFAARCARRVQPIFLHAWSDAPQIHVEAIEKGITLTETSAAVPNSASERKASRDIAIARAVDAAVPTPIDYTVRYAADKAARAAKAADATRATKYAATARAAAATTAVRYAAAAADRIELVPAIVNDFRILSVLSVQEGWDDNTPVPPEVFGPMWPEGVPEGWPVTASEEPSGDSILSIEVDVPEDIDADQLEQIIFELVDRMDDVHRAEGGRGIVIDSVDVPLRVRTPKGVC